jgi:ABC-2 type transport system permease protein
MKKFLRDTYLIFFNELLITIRNPFWIVFGLFSPVIYLLLFEPFLKGIAGAPGFPSVNAIQFFAPGLLLMNAILNPGFAGFGLMDKIREGFLERLRVSPISRIALVMGFVLVNATTLIMQSIVLVLTALLFGFHFELGGLLVLMLLLLIVGVMMASISYSVALIVRDEGILSGVVNFFTQPLMLLSGIMLPIGFAPVIIQNIAKFNPFTYAVDAARSLVGGFSLARPVVVSFIVFIILTVVALAWFIRNMKEAVA